MSKLHHKMQKCWSGMCYFQLFSANSFIIVFDSPLVRDEVLKSKYHWFWNNVISVSAWKPFFVPDRFKPKICLVWFGLPNFPFEFMDLEVLKMIGDKLGTFLTSKSDMVDAVVLAKICVLVSLDCVCPRTCNLKSNDGIWWQPIDKMNNDLSLSPLIVDALLFMDFKIGKILSNNIEIVINHYDMGKDVGPKACENILNSATLCSALPELDVNILEHPKSTLNFNGLKSSDKPSKVKSAKFLDNISNMKNDNLSLGHRSENKYFNKEASSNIFMSSPNDEHLFQHIQDLVKDKDRRGNILPSDESVIILNVIVVHQVNELLNDHYH